MAVSGGTDSLALVHLAHNVLSSRGGRVVALTVDHGLRAGSGAEAARVAEWMRDAGIPHAILCWGGAKPDGNLQAAARQARYALLDRWCAANGILHLLTAHHADDQRETQVLRLSRRAGTAGLAGMSAVEPLDHCQILRPLLPVPRAQLEASLTARGLTWIDDPSNMDRRFDRVRVRAGLPDARNPDGDDTLAAARILAETASARLLARVAAVSPFGAVRLDRRTLASTERPTTVHVLGAVLAALGGGAYPPRYDRLDAAVEAWLSGAATRARTLGGCRLLPEADGALTVVREAGRIDDAAVLAADGEILWDGRFRLRAGPEARGLSVARLTDAAWRSLRRTLPWIERFGLSRPVRTALPGIYRGERIVGLPSLGAWVDRPSGPEPGPVSAVFAPRRALTGAGFVAAAGLVCKGASVV